MTKAEAKVSKVNRPPAVKKMEQMTASPLAGGHISKSYVWRDWQGCYDESNKPWYVGEAYAHPAKMAIRLCRRIFEFMVSEGMLKKGDVVVDPFGGIGTTGLVGAVEGFRVVLVELEEKFVALTVKNIEKLRPLLEKMNRPVPVVVRGDSRRLAQIIAECGLGQSRPPASQEMKQSDASPLEGDLPTERTAFVRQAGTFQSRTAGVVTSPPYASVDGTKEFKSEGELKKFAEGQRGSHPGRSDEALEKVVKGFGSVVTSPPFGDPHTSQKSEVSVITSPPYEETASGTKNTNTNDAKRGHPTKPMVYSKSAENIGNMKGGEPARPTVKTVGMETRETYWGAMGVVYGECFKILKPGGWMAVVVKDFVRAKKRVPLCDNTVRLLEHIGFRVEVRVRASLVKDMGVADMYHGGTKRKERKSFFRRVAESKGSPRIDWEEVVFARKRHTPNPSHSAQACLLNGQRLSGRQADTREGSANGRDEVGEKKTAVVTRAEQSMSGVMTPCGQKMEQMTASPLEGDTFQSRISGVVTSPPYQGTHVADEGRRRR